MRDIFITHNSQYLNLYCQQRYKRNKQKDRKSRYDKKKRKLNEIYNNSTINDGNKVKKGVKKKVKWLDKEVSLQYAYNTKLKKFSTLFNQISEYQKKQIQVFCKDIQMVESNLSWKNRDDGGQEIHRFENESISKKGMWSLYPSRWIRDDVVNIYCKLLEKRDDLFLKSKLHTKPNIFLHTNFYTLLEKKLPVDNYLKNKVNHHTSSFFDVDKVFIPVNIDQMHWALVVINVEKQIIEFYDSMGSGGAEIMTNISGFVEMEYEKKYNSSLPQMWRKKNMSRTIPQQTNSWDCGVFMIAFMDMLSVGDILNFSQQHINHFRERIQLSIITNNCFM